MYDYQAAKTAKIDFIFLSKWTEVNNWESEFSNNAYLDLTALLN
jgi:hypothetical protein